MLYFHCPLFFFLESAICSLFFSPFVSLACFSLSSSLVYFSLSPSHLPVSLFLLHLSISLSFSISLACFSLSSSLVYFSRLFLFLCLTRLFLSLSPAQSSVSLLLFSTYIAILFSFYLLFMCNLPQLSHLSALSSRNVYQTWLAERYHVGWLHSHAIGLCVSTTTTVKTTTAAPMK